MMNDFLYPHILYFLLLIPLLIIWYILRGSKALPTMKISSIAAFNGSEGGWKNILRHLLFALKLAILALLIIALARPQDKNAWQENSVEGIDIMIATDYSGSMSAEDLKPSRYEAAKEMAERFINNRPNDNIGAVIFAAQSYTLCPLTSDHAMLLKRLENSKMGVLEDGTAIGMGLATSVDRLKTSKAKSKVVILLTDGVNNAGEISPMMAAKLAKTFGIRVYTIGIGSNGMAPFPQIDMFGRKATIYIPVQIDEIMLKNIAQQTGGEYFRAINTDKLRKIYDAIDKLEKSKLKAMSFVSYKENFPPYVLAAILLLAFEFILRFVVVRNKP